ncbi:phenoloxidase-activating factor 2-like [Cylas formicarius]|uniref:phenoloxidase-activating factor 2-like n=1 Tax=Cylas formicarius TaxID=197179 RepID=UPI0029587E5C|nr:phenoloxidase-activating factor 2-like [Cylas formicarius]
MRNVCAYFMLILFGVGISESTRVARSKRQATNASNEIDDNLIIEIFNNCKCVLHFQCDADNFIITGGQSLIEERADSIKRVICKGGNYSGQVVCCKLRGDPELKEPSVDTTTTTTTEGTTATTKGSEATKKPKTRKCGTQLPLINVRIFAGEDELTPVHGEFPWMTAIYTTTNGNKYDFHCTGSLIHGQVVLTANHCVRRFKASDVTVILNSQIELLNVGENPEMQRNVKEIITHPEYNSGALYNDIALMVLDVPYDVNNKSVPINTLCVNRNTPFENLKCLVAGWGKKPPMIGQTQILKKVELPTIEHAQCQNLLRGTRLGPYFILDESFMCAGGEHGKDACKGDGGSPLMCPSSSGNSMFQVGIVSWGIGCGTKNVPGVYTNVAKFHSWIKNELQNRNIAF